MRSILVVLCVVLMFSLAPQEARAQSCVPQAMRLDDLTGMYESWEVAMRVQAFPCGGIAVMWSNEFGTHTAGYYAVEQIPTGGVIARLTYPDPLVRSLDGRNVLTLKPAEPGFVQVITMGPYGDNLRVYRLAKVV